MEAYSSMEAFIEDRMAAFPKVGDKKASLWRIIILTDKFYEVKEVGQWFGVSEVGVRLLKQ